MQQFERPNLTAQFEDRRDRCGNGHACPKCRLGAIDNADAHLDRLDPPLRIFRTDGQTNDGMGVGQRQGRCVEPLSYRPGRRLDEPRCRTVTPGGIPIRKRFVTTPRGRLQRCRRRRWPVSPGRWRGMQHLVEDGRRRGLGIVEDVGLSQSLRSDGDPWCNEHPASSLSRARMRAAHSERRRTSRSKLRSANA